MTTHRELVECVFHHLGPLKVPRKCASETIEQYVSIVLLFRELNEIAPRVSCRSIKRIRNAAINFKEALGSVSVLDLRLLIAGCGNDQTAWKERLYTSEEKRVLLLNILQVIARSCEQTLKTSSKVFNLPGWSALVSYNLVSALTRSPPSGNRSGPFYSIAVLILSVLSRRDYDGVEETSVRRACEELLRKKSSHLPNGTRRPKH
jgi:hypothetical protein